MFLNVPGKRRYAFVFFFFLRKKKKNVLRTKGNAARRTIRLQSFFRVTI